MYDKVKLWIPRTRDMPDIGNFLDEAKEQTNLKTGEVSLIGSINGLRVSINVGGVSIVGSLTRLLYPNNIYPLDRHSTAEAVKCLSDSIHMDAGAAKVTGLEFGKAFIMANPVECYLSRLGDMDRMLRIHLEKGTLYYKPRGRTQSRVIAFYDKMEEIRSKGWKIPRQYDDVNMLRYEIRFNGRLSKRLNVPYVDASTLSDKDFYRSMVKRYQETYFSISKSNQISRNDMSGIKTVQDAYDTFVARLLAESGEGQITAFMDELKGAKVFDDRNNYTRLKRKIQKIAAKAGSSVPDELSKELDDEIKNVGAYV